MPSLVCRYHSRAVTLIVVLVITLKPETRVFHGLLLSPSSLSLPIPRFPILLNYGHYRYFSLSSSKKKVQIKIKPVLIAYSYGTAQYSTPFAGHNGVVVLCTPPRHPVPPLPPTAPSLVLYWPRVPTKFAIAALCGCCKDVTWAPDLFLFLSFFSW